MSAIYQRSDGIVLYGMLPEFDGTFCRIALLAVRRSSGNCCRVVIVHTMAMQAQIKPRMNSIMTIFRVSWTQEMGIALLNLLNHRSAK